MSHRRWGAPEVRRRTRIVEPGGDAVTFLLDYNDATFSRASEASQYGNFAFPDGADDLSVSDMTWAGTNVARIYAADGSVLIEEARTNSITQSEAFDTWSPGVTPTITTNYAAAPDGAVDADRVECDGTDYLYRTIAPTGDCASSIWVRATSGTSYMNGGIIKSTGTPYDYDQDLHDTTWVRETFYLGSGDADYHFAADGRAKGSLGVGVRDVVLWGAQAEYEKAYPTSYIRTSGTTATRARDSMVVTSGNWNTQIALGKFAIDVWPLFASSEGPANGYIIQCGTGGSAGYLRWSSAAGGQFVLQQAGNTVAQTGVSFSRYQKLTLTCDATNGTIEVAGATTGDGEASGTVGAWPTGVSLYFGSLSAGTQHCNARYSRPRAA